MSEKHRNPLDGKGQKMVRQHSLSGAVYLAQTAFTLWCGILGSVFYDTILF